MNKFLTNYTNESPDSLNTTNIPSLTLIIVAIVLLLLLLVATLYLIAGFRRKNVILKKLDYLIEDITYKSESLNVTVETLNKLSNYALSIDLVSQKGFKSMVKFASENKNYIYTIIEKLRHDVEKRENFYAENKKKSTKEAEKKKKTTKSTPKKSTESKASVKKDNLGKK